MPKRILDGEGLWGSRKIAMLPPWAKAEFAWLLPLALADGSFECDARSIWSQCYSFNRPEVTVDQVMEILAAFERGGLLFRWTHEDGHIWGYWVGIEKAGRLPPASRIERKEHTCGKKPPAEELRQYVRNASLGSGSGSGLGSGSGSGSGITKAAQEQAPSRIAEPPQFAYQGLRLRVTIRQDSLLRDAFPWVERQAEYAKMESWLEANPLRRPKSPSRFAHNWFSKIASPGGPNGKGGKHAERTRGNLEAAKHVLERGSGAGGSEMRPALSGRRE